MTKRLLFFFIAFCSHSLLWGQLPLTKQAAKQCQEKDFVGALASIDAAINDAEEAANAYTWYVKGYIHKEVYKTSELSQYHSPQRELAVDAFKKSVEIDQNKEYATLCQTALRYLATSYYNDALKHSREITANTENEPIALYNRFKETMKLVDANTSFSPFDIEINKSMASMHYLIWQNDISNTHHAEQCAHFYEALLTADPTNCHALYNLSILYYNQGVYKIRSIDSNTDIIQLIMIQDECVALFKQALPYAEKTFENCPKKLEYYKALMFAHRALGHEDMYNKYLSESEDLINQGILKQ